MLESLDHVLAVVAAIFHSQEVPKAFRLLTVPREMRTGRNARELARELGTTSARVKQIAAAADPIGDVFGITLQVAQEEAKLAKARQGLGQMLLGTICERAFEDLYRETMGTTELRLEDTREGGTDTDYRVFNGSGKPVFRINIKFHGSPFRKAQDLVGLEPEDCFALATYKINHAKKKQQEEFLPYIFVILGVPGLRGETVGSALPPILVHFASLALASSISGKRRIEDCIIRHLVDDPQPDDVRSTVADFGRQIRAAQWRVLSAVRADNLLHEKLFDRVYALRVKRFTQNYGRAEVDMHFSISQDLTPLEEFLSYLRDHGIQGLTGRLAVGAV
jgi:hypothetical protein